MAPRLLLLLIIRQRLWVGLTVLERLRVVGRGLEWLRYGGILRCRQLGPV